MLAAGHLPNLSSLVLVAVGYPPEARAMLQSLPPPGFTLLPPVSPLLLAHPGITVRLVPRPSAWGLEQLRVRVMRQKGSMRPEEHSALLAWLLAD